MDKCSSTAFVRQRSVSWDGCDVSDLYVDVKDLCGLPKGTKVPSLVDLEALRTCAVCLVAVALSSLAWVTVEWWCSALSMGNLPLYASALVMATMLLRGVPSVLGAVLLPPSAPRPTRPFQQQCPLKAGAARPRPPRCVLLVFNPSSGTRKAKVAAEMVKERLQSVGVRVEEFETKYVGHARYIADSVRSDHDAVVVVGGDGTLHEVINGLHGTELPVAIVPAGTGNGLATSLMKADAGSSKQSEHGVDWAVRQLICGSILKMDRLDVAAGRRRFDGAGLVYFGLCAEVDIVAEPLRFMGSMRFDVAAVCQLLKLKAMGPTTIEAVLGDGSTKTLSGPFLAIYVGNSQYWTDKMRAVPGAVLDDGNMELIVIKVTCRTELLRGFLLLESGAHVLDRVSCECIETLKVRSASFTFWDSAHKKPASGFFNVDGEIFRHEGYVRIGCHYQAQPIFAGSVL